MTEFSWYEEHLEEIHEAAMRQFEDHEVRVEVDAVLSDVRDFFASICPDAPEPSVDDERVAPDPAGEAEAAETNPAAEAEAAAASKAETATEDSAEAPKELHPESSGTNEAAGMPATPATAESEADPANPNA